MSNTVHSQIFSPDNSIKRILASYKIFSYKENPMNLVKKKKKKPNRIFIGLFLDTCFKLEVVVEIRRDT